MNLIKTEIERGFSPKLTTECEALFTELDEFREDNHTEGNEEEMIVVHNDETDRLLSTSVKDYFKARHPTAIKIRTVRNQPKLRLVFIDNPLPEVEQAEEGEETEE